MKRMENAFKIVDNTDAMLAFWDKDLVCRFANAAYIKWFGFSPYEMINKITLPELLGPLYEKNLPYITNALNGKLQVFERDIQLPNGQIRNTIATYRPEIHNGEVTGFYVHVADVSKLKNANFDIHDSIVDYNKINLNEKDMRLDAVERQLRSSIFSGFPGIEVLAKEHYISVTKLKQDFKKRYQSTIFSYYRNLQMQIAEKYIQEKIYSKSQAASMLGFANPSNFITCYQKYLSTKQKTEKAIVIDESDLIARSYIDFISRSPGAIAIFDRDMRFLAMSQKWMEHAKDLDKKSIGKTLYEVFPNAAPQWKKTYLNCLKGKISTGEGLITSEDGTTDWRSWEIKPWYISEKIIGGVIIYVETIDHIKENVVLLKEENNIFKKITEHLHIGYWQLRIEDSHLTCNDAAKKILGLPVNIEPDWISFLIFFKEGQDRSLIKECLDNSAITGKTYDIEANIITVAGSEKRLRITLFSIIENNICKIQYGSFQEIEITK